MCPGLRAGARLETQLIEGVYRDCVRQGATMGVCVSKPGLDTMEYTTQIPCESGLAREEDVSVEDIAV